MSRFTGRQNKHNPIDKFHVDEQACIGCGTCQQVCPTDTVQLVGGMPVWEGDQCCHFLACLHR